MPAITPMPPEFQLKHPRRVRWSGWHRQQDGSDAHCPRRLNIDPPCQSNIDPGRGLHRDDLAAYRESQRGPVARFFARLKFWPTKVKAEGEFEIPAFLRNQSD